MERKKVLVTGGSRGIGYSVVQRLLDEGYEVFSPSRNELDLSNNSSLKLFIEKFSSIGFDCIVNNAGINEINDIDCVTDDEITRTININLIAPLKLLRSFVPYMKANNYGRIVNIGSIWSLVSKPGRVVYSASKHGIHGITKTLAVELASHNILVNTVCPGYTLTELTKKNNTEAQIKSICNDIPMKRMAEPSEIADLICYLISDRNTYITGQEIAVDGGYTSK